MIAAGVIGAVILGFVQDKEIDTKLRDYDKANNSALHDTYATETKSSIFGSYQAVDQARVLATSPENQAVVKGIQESAKKSALKTVAIFPVIMFISYVILIFYFRSKGGYKAVDLGGKAP